MGMMDDIENKLDEAGKAQLRELEAKQKSGQLNGEEKALYEKLKGRL